MATASESQRFLLHPHFSTKRQLQNFILRTIPHSRSYCINTSNSVVQSANINCHWVLLWLSLNPDSISTSISQLAFLYLWKMFTKSGSLDLGQLLTLASILLAGGLVARSFPTGAIEPQRHTKPWSTWRSFISSSLGLVVWDFCAQAIFEGSVAHLRRG